MWLKARTAASEVRREKGRKSTGSLEGQFKDVSSALAGVALVYRAVACEPKSHKFYSQSGHMPGLQPRTPAGDPGEATIH